MSYTPKNRDQVHRRDKESQVYKFSKNNNVETPTVNIIETNIPTIEEASEKEKQYIQYYKDLNYNVLNKTKGGEKRHYTKI